jgi:glycosyltransferase involved in cell wall biosynthesis
MNPTTGGPCQGIRYINSQTANIGTVREVVCLDEPTSSYLGMDDFPIHALGPTFGPWQYTPKLKPWLDANITRFDVIILNGIWIYSSYAGFKTVLELKKQNLKATSKKFKVPKVFVMPHGMLDPYFQQADTRGLKRIRNLLYWILIERKVINNADAILFTCETELKLARKTFFSYHPKKEINVGYGIYEPPAFSLKMQNTFLDNCPGLGSQPYILFLSRVNDKKGVDLLIKSYAEIVKQALVKEKKIPMLVIAGPGLDTSFGEKMQHLVTSNPEIKDLVLFTGMLTGDAKWGALYGCDAFILPSHQENFGIAVVEALACKKPVLISDQINIWKEIIDGGGGIVVKDTLEDTKKMLNQWLNLSPSEKKIMGECALEIFNTKFHIEQSSKNLLEAINSEFTC